MFGDSVNDCFSFFGSTMAVRLIVNQWVVGSNPTRRAMILDDVRTTYILPAFLEGWKKTEDLKVDSVTNKQIAELFGTVVTKVKVYPTDNQGWIIIDKHTKKLLYKNIKNKNDVDMLCKQHNLVP